jgi:hypothetical protein
VPLLARPAQVLDAPEGGESRAPVTCPR